MVLNALTEILKAILFGIVEGVTEWLPVSSTGHMIILNELLPLRLSPQFYEMFQVVIQLGAILAVLLRFARRLNPFGTDERHKKARRLLCLSVIAVIPSAAVGFFLDDILEEYLYNPLTVSAALIFYGIVFVVIDEKGCRHSANLLSCEELSPGRAFSIGLFQTLSLVPGTSRSGATIIGGLLLGVGRSVATEFSFFLAIPTMLGAGALKTSKYFLEGGILGKTEIWVMAAGVLTAFLVSNLAIGFLTDFVKSHGFTAFGIYRIALGIAVWLFFTFER